MWVGILEFALVGLKLLPNAFFAARKVRFAVFADAECGAYLDEPKLPLAYHCKCPTDSSVRINGAFLVHNFGEHLSVICTAGRGDVSRRVDERARRTSTPAKESVAADQEKYRT